MIPLELSIKMDKNMIKSQAAVLPLQNAESSQNLFLVSKLDLHLLPEVEDGTISAGAQHLLVQTSLKYTISKFVIEIMAELSVSFVEITVEEICACYS